jgi:hypothetical protein
MVINDPKIGEREISSGISHSFSQPGDAERLAWGSSDKHPKRFNVPSFMVRDVAMVPHIRVMVRENARGEFFDFGEADRLPAKRMPGDGGGFDAGADTEIFHRFPLRYNRLTVPIRRATVNSPS